MHDRTKPRGGVRVECAAFDNCTNASGSTPSSLSFTVTPLTRIHKFMTPPNIAVTRVRDDTFLNHAGNEELTWQL